MKRAVHVLSALLAAVILLFAVTGCVQRRVPKEVELEYTAMQVGFCDCIDGVKQAILFAQWPTKPYVLGSAPAEVTISFQGAFYTGEYNITHMSVLNFSERHRYEAKNESIAINGKTGQTVYFEINAETGALTSFQILNTEPNRTILDEGKGRLIADAIADDYLNLEDYQVFVSMAEDNRQCRYTYYRRINGIKLADQLSVVVNGNGDVTYFSITSLGSFHGIDAVTFDEAQAKLAIEDKLDVIYAEDERKRQYEITDKTLIRMTDGNFAVLYSIKMQFERSEGDMIQHDCTLQLLVTAQPKTDTP